MFRQYLILCLTIGFFAIVPQAIAEGQIEITPTAPPEGRALTPRDILVEDQNNVLLTLRVHNIQVQERWDILSDQKDNLTIIGGTLSSHGIVPPTLIIATIVVEDMFEKLNPNYANLSAQITITLDFLPNSGLPHSPFWRALVGQIIRLYTFDADDGYNYSVPNTTLFAIQNNQFFTSRGNATVGLYTIIIQAQIGDRAEEITARVQIYPALSLDDAPPLEFESTSVTAATVPLVLHTFTVTGGIENKTYTLIAAQEQYFSLGSDGVLSLVDNLIPNGVYTMTIRAIDEDNNFIDALATVRIVPHSGLTDFSLWRALFGQAITLYTLTVGNVYTYSVLNHATLFTIDDNGFFTASGDAPVGLYTITIQARSGMITDQGLASVRIYPTLSLTNAPPLTLDATLVMAETPISLHAFMAHGGIENITYALIAEHANYFSLGSNTGILSLVDNLIPHGVYTMTIRAIDERNNFIDALAMVRIVPPLVLDDVAFDIFAENFAELQHTFIAAGGFGDKTYTLIAGNDDHYFALSANGVLSLTMTALAGLYTLSIQVTDARDYAATARAVIEITDLFIADVLGLSAVDGRPKVLHTLIANGDTTNLTYRIIAGNTSGYFSLTDSGVLSVNDNAPMGFYTVVVKVNNAHSSNQAHAIIEITPSLSFTQPHRDTRGSLVFQIYGWEGITTRAYTFQASGGEGTIVYNLRLLGNSADNFKLDDAQGHFSVVAAAEKKEEEGPYILIVDAMTDYGDNTFAYVYVSIVPPIVIDPIPTLYAAIGQQQEYRLVARGGFGIDYSIENYAQTPFLELNGNILSITPDRTGSFTVIIRGSDKLAKDGQDALFTSATMVLHTFRPLSLIAPRYGSFTEGDATNLYTVVGYGGFGDYTYRLASDYDADYFTLDSSGVLAIKTTPPPEVRPYVLSLVVNDNLNNVYGILVSVAVVDNLELADVPFLDAVVGAAVNLYTLSVSGGGQKKTFTIVPGGNGANYFTLERDSGILRMNYNANVGVYKLFVKVSDEHGYESATGVDVELVDPLLLTPVPLPTVNAGEVVHVFSATGGGAEKTYTIIAGDDEDYFTFRQGHGILLAEENTPVGNYSLRVAVRDQYGNQDQVLLMVEIIDHIFLRVSPLYLEVGPAGNVSTLVASGGGANLTYTIVEGNEDGYFTLGGNDGVLSRNADVPRDVYTLSVEVSDEHDDKYVTEVVVDVLFLTVQGSNVNLLVDSGITYFRFPKGKIDIDRLSLIKNYYIYYRGRYFQFDESPPGNSQEDVVVVEHPIGINGDNNFMMVHKSLVDGTAEATKKAYFYDEVIYYPKTNTGDWLAIRSGHNSLPHSTLWFESLDGTKKAQTKFISGNTVITGLPHSYDVWEVVDGSELFQNQTTFQFIISQAIGD